MRRYFACGFVRDWPCVIGMGSADGNVVPSYACSSFLVITSSQHKEGTYLVIVVQFINNPS